VTIVSADLLVVTQRLHAAVARIAGIDPGRLLLCATHTHSSPGGYWRGSLVERFMGPFVADTFERLATELGCTAIRAASDARPAKLRGAQIDLPDASRNRRAARRPTDPALSLLEGERDDSPPVCIVSFGAHAVTVMGHDPRVASADFPGELCTRLESKGYRPLFLQGAVGAASPSFPAGPSGEGIARMADTLEMGIDSARRALTPFDPGAFVVHAIPLAATPSRCRIFPGRMPGGPLLEAAVWPARRALTSMGRQGFRDNFRLQMRLARMGDLALLTVPAEIGPSVSVALRSVLRCAGVTLPVVVSMCNGYAGYAHRAEEYEARSGPTPLALYENAMSLAGWDLGDRIIEAVKGRLRS
jgi:hypothetical protein